MREYHHEEPHNPPDAGMTTAIITALLGLGAGSLIALSASGLVLVFRSSGVINFAHGGIGMIGSYVFYELAVDGTWPVWPAVATGILASALLGVLTFVLTVQVPRGASILTQCIGTVAVMLILQAAGTLRYGQNGETVSQFLPTGRTSFGQGVEMSNDRLTLLLVAVAITVLMATAYRRTSFGIATSAVAESSRNLSALGWRVGLLQAVNWGLGGGLAGMALILTAPISGISTIGGTLIIVPVLAAALIGRLRSFPLTLIGGLVIGIVQAQLARNDYGVSGIVDAVPFAIIIGVLLVRGSSLPLRSDTGQRLPRIGSGGVAIIPAAVALVGIIVVLFSASPESASAITTSVLFAIPVLSLTLVLGYAGQLSLAQLTLAGVGALIAARLMVDAGLPFLAAILLAGVLTVPVGLLVGIPSVRTRGIILAVATLGLAVAIQALVFGNTDLTNGTNGILISEDGSPLSIFGWDIDPLFTPERYGLVAVLGFAGCALIVMNLRRGRSGRRLIAVRSNERAAAALGIGVSSAKLWAFGIGSAIAGFGGALMALRFPAVLFDQFGVFNNISAIALSVFGGAGSVVGALVGASIAPAGLAEYLLSSVSEGWAQYIPLIGGIALLATVVGFADGVAVALTDRSRTVGQLLGRVGALLSAGPGNRTAESIVDASRGDASQPVTPAALVVDDLSVSFGGVNALQHVSLRVEPGQVVGLIGPNGAGKTTFIDAVTGFAPTVGTVTIGKHELRPSRPHLRARAGLSRSFQSLELFEDLTVFDNLRTASDPRDSRSYLIDLVRPKRGRLTSETIAAIDQFELHPHLDKLPTELTFGQRRLVSMARSIASAPSVLLLDEPCAGLDETERAETSAIIREVAKARGMAVLLVEHDVELVRRVCDEVVVLDFGQVIAQGSPDVVLADQRVIDAYLGADFELEDVDTQTEGVIA